MLLHVDTRQNRMGADAVVGAVRTAREQTLPFQVRFRRYLDHRRR
jgi:hypothetical protein